MHVHGPRVGSSQLKTTFDVLRQVRSNWIAILSSVIVVGHVFGAEESSSSPAWESRYNWNLAGIAFTRSEDPGGDDLNGIRLSWGGCDCSGSDIGDMGGEIFVQAEYGDTLDVYETGGQLRWPVFWFHYLDCTPRVTLGIEYRRDDPNQGLGGYGGIGFEVGTWAGNRVKIAACVDREFGFSSGTRNQYGIAVRVGAMQRKRSVSTP